MSNFICSECGMTNIDCGRAGYKTPKEIELEKKVHILNEANMKLENELGHFADLSKKIERLQEQIYEANGIIGELYHLCHDKKKASSVVCDYLVKYGKTVEVK